MVYIILFPWTDAAIVRLFTYPSYHSESEYGTVNSIILNMFELWLNPYSLYATFESHSTLAQRSGQNFRISHHNFTNMNTPIDQYLGIVNHLLIITNLQVDLDIPNLKAMCTTWLGEQRHRVQVCEMLLKITLMISSPRIICTTATRRWLLTDLDTNIHVRIFLQVSSVLVL